MNTYLLKQPFNFGQLNTLMNKHSLKMIMSQIIMKATKQQLSTSENELLNICRMFVCQSGLLDMWIEQFEQPFTGLGEAEKMVISDISDKFVVTTGDKMVKREK
mmetsp:Transcript_42301/g.64874  ORF Transcript_42301/g.64874 Transcript_42301/m.64874 type:complete len:104 (-) Transcript_42301:2414-2725(-)